MLCRGTLIFIDIVYYNITYLVMKIMKFVTVLNVLLNEVRHTV